VGYPRLCLRANYSATLKAPLPTQRQIEQGDSSLRMRAPFSWTKSQTSRLLNRQSCCESSKREILNESVHLKLCTRTCRSSPLQIQTLSRKWQRVVLGRTCCFA